MKKKKILKKKKKKNLGFNTLESTLTFLDYFSKTEKFNRITYRKKKNIRILAFKRRKKTKSEAGESNAV